MWLEYQRANLCTTSCSCRVRDVPHEACGLVSSIHTCMHTWLALLLFNDAFLPKWTSHTDLVLLASVLSPLRWQVSEITGRRSDDARGGVVLLQGARQPHEYHAVGAQGLQTAYVPGKDFLLAISRWHCYFSVFQ